MNRPSRHELPLVALAFAAAPTAAHAYVDPGAAGFVITSVPGFLAARTGMGGAVQVSGAGLL